MFLFGRYIQRKCIICGDSAKPGTHYCGDVGCKRFPGYVPAVNPKDAIRDTIENYLWESDAATVSYAPPDGDLRGELIIIGQLNSRALADAIVNTLAKDHPADVKRRAKRLNAWLASLPKHQPRQFIGLP